MLEEHASVSVSDCGPQTTDVIQHMW